MSRCDLHKQLLADCNFAWCPLAILGKFPEDNPLQQSPHFFPDPCLETSPGPVGLGPVCWAPTQTSGSEPPRGLELGSGEGDFISPMPPSQVFVPLGAC